MTIENWLAIVMIIVTLISPMLAVLVASRINQPKQRPEPSHPKSRSQRIGGWLMKAFGSVWWLILVFIYNLYLLVSNVRSEEPLNRLGVVFLVIPLLGTFLTLAILLGIALYHLERER